LLVWLTKEVIAELLPFSDVEMTGKIQIISAKNSVVQKILQKSQQNF
jgi:hypothetical protein